MPDYLGWLLILFVALLTLGYLRIDTNRYKSCVYHRIARESFTPFMCVALEFPSNNWQFDKAIGE